MKLLVDARTGWNLGIGRVVANTVPRVARRRPDWRIDVLSPPDHVDAMRTMTNGVPNLRVVPCALEPFSLAEQTQLGPHARGYDLTWFTNYWVPLAWRGRFAVTVHDMLHLLPDLFPASRLKRRLSRLTFGKVRRDAAAVMFDSRFTHDAFVRMVGTPRRGVTVALGGDHLDYGAIRPIAQRSRRLLVVAAAKKHKNFSVLFEAWRRAKVGSHWTLTVISPREQLRSSVDVAAMAANGAAVDIRRGISNAELAALYADTAILLTPSLYEGFGLPLVEGMLAGALCVSATAGSMVEIAQGAFVQFVNGSDLDGWVTAIEDACALVDRDEPGLDFVTRHNAARASRLTWDGTARDVVGVLEAAAA